MAGVYAMVIPTEVVGGVRFTFDAEGHLETVKMRCSEMAGASGKRPAGAPTVAAVRSWLRGYLAGRDVAFPGKWKNPGQTAFARKVYQVTARLKVGKTLSYGEVAAKAGSAGASRAVGNAMGRNPIPLVVP
ncbi:MAG: methylated-DNA--[protein]-cysteine S-methyltransferase [Planctomycetota bacterium]|jgi:methylated-DNA-[protein]-cysteine S-methyltransferase